MQGDLFAPRPRPSRRHEAAFRAFDAANPLVWKLFVRFTLEVVAAGRTRYSSDAIFHRIRWHVDIETRSADDFKLNNNFTAYYARKFMDAYPQHAGFFETRVQKQGV